uniref:Uncharacterized protein n=1 Tax=Ascaris lumbricoides TaxID=6252 RepID=A0A9J2PFJ4_ASCLU
MLPADNVISQEIFRLALRSHSALPSYYEIDYAKLTVLLQTARNHRSALRIIAVLSCSYPRELRMVVCICQQSVEKKRAQIENITLTMNKKHAIVYNDFCRIAEKRQDETIHEAPPKRTDPLL